MLHKIGLALLSISALCYALYLIARKKPLPEPLPEKGLHRRFFLATVVCIAVLGGGLTYYGTASPEQRRARQLGRAMQAAWLSLELDDMERFHELVDEAVLRELIAEETGQRLKLALFAKKLPLMPSCYSTTVPEVPYERTDLIAGHLLQRINILEEAKAADSLSPEVLAQAEVDIAREIAILQAKIDFRDEWKHTNQLPEHSDEIRLAVEAAVEQFEAAIADDKQRPKPSEPDNEASRIVVEMETQDDFRFKD